MEDLEGWEGRTRGVETGVVSGIVRRGGEKACHCDCLCDYGICGDSIRGVGFVN